MNLPTKFASGIVGLVSNFTIVLGGSGNDQLTGNATLSSILIGGAGSDTLVGGTDGLPILDTKTTGRMQLVNISHLIDKPLLNHWGLLAGY